ncbi:MAG TPA: hypothetical protein VNO21_06295 [Polyangiaceae bacterium]|nr:hypothetical protein [Polyangiaceae bacterium]
MSEESNFDANSLQDELRPTRGPTGTRTATNGDGARAAISIALQ